MIFIAQEYGLIKLGFIFTHKVSSKQQGACIYDVMVYYTYSYIKMWRITEHFEDLCNKAYNNREASGDTVFFLVFGGFSSDENTDTYKLNMSWHCFHFQLVCCYQCRQHCSMLRMFLQTVQQIGFFNICCTYQSKRLVRLIQRFGRG